MKTIKHKYVKKTAVCLLLFIPCLLVFSAEIDRKTFSISLPDKWAEDTKDDMYSPDSFIFFDGPESCLFTVMVGKKSAGASVDDLLKNQIDSIKKKFTDEKIAKITKWSRFDGKGFKIEGKIQGIFITRFTVFGFEKGDYVCLVEESATLGDYKTYANDFEKIRQSFKLK